MDDEQTQWFRGTNGMVWGTLAFVIAAGVIALDIASGWHPPVGLGGLLFAVLAYVSLIRPRIGVGREELVLDHMFSTVRIPVAAVDSVAVGRTFEARVAGRSYVSAAVNRSLRDALRGRDIRGAEFTSGARPNSFRQMLRGRSQVSPPARPEPPRSKQHEVSYADFVVERVHSSAANARERAGIASDSPRLAQLAEEVRRTWAWPEIIAVAVIAVVFVVSIFVWG